MSRLSPEQQQLILDFYFRCGEEEDINAGRDLIASDPEAARLYSHLEETLTELDNVYEPCPENLAELTVARLKLAARAQKEKASASQPSRLADLLDQESRKSYPAPSSNPPSETEAKSRPNFLRVGFEIAAMAASIVLISALLLPAFSTMRAHSRQVACQANLGRIGKALITYADDHDGRFAAARLQPGDPWWMVGDQSQRPRSSTRYVWQLVRLGYADGKDFICAGHREGRPIQYDPATMSGMQDFASPNNISYSVMIRCDREKGASSGRRRILMSDMNPVFVRFRKRPDLFRQRSDFEKVLLDEQLKKLLSPNHGQRGQNVLLCDGAVTFLKTRQYKGDDIFTVRGVVEYTGREVPADEDDIFLVP